MNEPDVSILLVTFNAPRHVLRLFRSLRQTSGVAYEVVVVDNRSKASTRWLLHLLSWRRAINTLTLLDHNTLFAGGVNTALRVSNPGSRHVLLLNPDIEIRDPRLAAATAGRASAGRDEPRLRRGRPVAASRRLLLGDRPRSVRGPVARLSLVVGRDQAPGRSVTSWPYRASHPRPRRSDHARRWRKRSAAAPGEGDGDRRRHHPSVVRRSPR